MEPSIPIGCALGVVKSTPLKIRLAQFQRGLKLLYFEIFSSVSVNILLKLVVYRHLLVVDVFIHSFFK